MPEKMKRLPTQSLFGFYAPLTSLFFIWGFTSVLVDLSIPHLKDIFGLSFFEVLIVQSAYFLAYLFLGFLSGKLVSRHGLKNGIMTGLMLMALGTFFMISATLTENFYAILLPIFIVACGVTFLQVAANPAAGLGKEKSISTYRLNIFQGFHSLGTVAAPLLSGIIILGLTQNANGDITPVRHAFLVVFALLLPLIVIFHKNKSFNEVEYLKNSINNKLNRNSSLNLILGCAGIFLYVGAEVSIGSTLINYLEQDHILAIDRSSATKFVSLFWGGALVGRFLGAGIIYSFGGARILMISACCACVCSLAVFLGTGHLVVVAVLSIGLFNGVLFPTIFALSLRGLSPSQTPIASGWLCTAIIGGGIVPLLFGVIADTNSLSTAYIVPAICYSYISWLGFFHFCFRKKEK